MGCDIHMYAEKFSAKTGKWTALKGFLSDYYIAGDSYFGTEEYKKSVHPYAGRDYTLFAWLADVRNSNPGDLDYIKPIYEPVGIPEDCSDLVGEESCSWDGDGHSHSHISLADLLAQDLTQRITYVGYVTITEYRKFLKDGKPGSWCGGVGGGGVLKCEPEEMEKFTQEFPDKSCYCKISWKETLIECTPFFFNTTLRALAKRAPKQLPGKIAAEIHPSIPYEIREIAENKDTGAVRIVFWFDN